MVGFLGYGVSLALFVLALRHLGTARTGAYFSLAPFVGAVIAIALLGEPLTFRLLLAGLLMAFGVYLHLAERHEHDHVHELLEHADAHVTTCITSTSMARAIRPESRTRIGTVMSLLRTDTATTPTCITDTGMGEAARGRSALGAAHLI